MKAISATEAHRHFARVLRRVAGGEKVPVFSRGRPVAKFSAAGTEQSSRMAARDELVKRLRTQQTSVFRAWSRDELYED